MKCKIQGEGWECQYPIQVQYLEMCSGHARRFRKGAELDQIFPRGVTRPKVNCTHPNCTRKAHGRVLCHAHLLRKREGRDMEAPIPRVRREAEDLKLCMDCGDSLERTTLKTARKARRCDRCFRLRRTEQVGRYGVTRRRAETLRLKYNLSVLAFESLLDSQGGACSGCGRLDSGVPGRHWAVDHDHSCCPKGGSCGECIRGVLCILCNLVLGNVRDDPEKLRNLADYLDRFEAQKTLDAREKRET